MNAPAKLSDFTTLTFSPDAASALTDTNGLARQLRAMPEHLMTPELRDDRERVLDRSLADLLAAHRDARNAGDPSADAELAAGLDHIRAEIVRIIADCQARARDTLTTQGNYLEQRYPVADGDELAAIPSAPIAERPSPPAGAVPHKLGKSALESLFSAKPAPEPRKEPVPLFIPADMGRVAFLVIALVIMLVGLGVQLHNNNRAANWPRYQPERLGLTATIDNVRRDLIPEFPEAKDSRKILAAVIELHGVATNKSPSATLESIDLGVDVLSCPTLTAPDRDCAAVDSAVVSPVQYPGLRPKLAARWERQVVMPIPDVTGHLRAKVYPYKSHFDGDPYPPSDN